jgi:pyridoxal phosphate enzyme (YggS family)
MKKHESMHDGLAAIRSRMAAAAREAGREPDEIALIAVSKTFGPDDIQPVIDAGHRAFGENRVQESQGKWPDLRAHAPDIELHLIGPLQSNKAKDAVALFDVIHTIDRPKIARVIAQEMAAQKRTPTLFIQVNTGEEPQKAGVSLADVAAFYTQCRDEFQLRIEGLMCIPPLDEDAEPHFRRLAEAAGELGLSRLSMGMSADFQTAIRCGATHIRVGSAIFGARPTPASTP